MEKTTKMTNKKKKWSEFILLLGLLIIIFFIIFIFVGLLIFVNKETPKFTIYKEECRNKTNSDEEYCIDKSVFCNWTAYNVPHTDFEVGCASESLIKKCEEKNATECIFYGNNLKIIKENKNYSYKECRHGTIEVCEKVEVDEIEIISNWHYESINFVACGGNEGLFGILAEDLNWSLSPNENCKIHEGEEFFSSVVSKEDIEDYYNRISPTNTNISKKDLTKKWLDENCEIVRYTPCEDKNQKSNLWHCGNYVVEVQNA